MSQVSRPMQIALAATLLLAVVWFVALRPRSSAGGGASAAGSAPAAQAPSSPSSGGGAAPGVAGLKSAIDKAHGAVSTASADAQRAAQSSADGAAPAAPARGTASAGGASHAGPAPVPAGSRPATPGPAPAPAARPQPKPHAAAPAGKHRPAGAHGPLRVVLAALHAHKAVAIAFLDSSSADSRAVAEEMRHVSTFGGRAVVLSLPLSRLSDYDFVTNKVQVTVAPTVVIVDRRARATEIVGFTDRGEIEQRLADALAISPRR